ncbi:hypothetical protein DDP54_03770 [Cellulomonas sp. WB94]|uniref:hypothetical protein n=1 Tax=Cellulomonas sp. WB94 TaxID=2173174 RepID=UPI000D5750D4|nr:hypothetical protein [Cellulomonas sp. WB94]PVU82263.1 hypothetical protein DDP54_03770 [Cellulomonas sp. WB94]
MDGSSWVALAGIGAGLSGTVFTQVWQRRGERERAVESREVRVGERWLELRRDVYLRFLAGADDCAEHQRARWHYLRYGTDGSRPIDTEEVAQYDGPMAIAEGLTRCAEALAEMRLFAPADVVTAASLFVELTRAIEYFGSMQAVNVRYDRAALDALRESSDVDEEGQRRSQAATELLAAMRKDLGADAADIDGLGPVSPTIYGC